MTNIVRRTFLAEFNQLGDRQVEVIISTDALAADGDIWVTEGVQLDRYIGNPVWLWDHKPDQPVARGENVRIDGRKIRCMVEFAPAGISPKADEICGLVKARIVNGVSAGALPLEMEPLDAKQPKGGQRWLRWELYETSFVTIPSNTEAMVVARAATAADWKVGASRNLAIADSEAAWDGDAAAASIFEHAGGEAFDSAKARTAFLVYDAGEPTKRTSYKLPIARAVDGELLVPKAALRAAAAQLAATNLPDDVKTAAGKVLDAYKETAGIGEEGDGAKGAGRRAPDLRRRMLRASPKLVVRDLYGVAQLAYLLDQLGYLHAVNVWEQECEADDSQVPAMLGEAMQKAGAALIAMTQEEVAELLTARGIEGIEADAGGEGVEVIIDEDLPAAERSFVAGAPKGRRRTWRRAFAHMRLLTTRAAGDGSTKTLQDAAEHHTRALERNGNTRAHLDTIGDQHEAVADSHTRAMAAHDRATQAINDAVEAANGATPADAADKIAKVQQQHRAVGKQLDAIGEARSALAEAHSNAANTAQLAHRSMRAAARCVRSLLDTTDGTTAELPEDAEGTAETRAAADLRRRQVAIAELSAAP